MLKRIEILDEVQFYLYFLVRIASKTMMYFIILSFIRYCITGYLDFKIIIIIFSVSLFVSCVFEYFKIFKENYYHIKSITFSSDTLCIQCLERKIIDNVFISRHNLSVIYTGKKLNIINSGVNYVVDSSYSKIKLDSILKLFKDRDVNIVYLNDKMY
jgi:hypothetical protein